MINKEVLRAAISDTLYEKSVNIDVANVLTSFINELSKVTISGFFTSRGREVIMEALVKPYKRAGSEEYVAGSTEMLLDIIILFWTNLKMRDITIEDLDSIISIPDEVIKGSSFPNEYKNMYDLSSNLVFTLLYLFRLNIAYIRNSLIDVPIVFSPEHK